MAEVGAYYITILPSMNSFTGKVKQELGAAGQAGGSSFAERFKATLLGSAIGTAIAGLASKAADYLTQGLDAGIKRYDTMSNFPKVMQNLGYSTEEAAKSVKTIQDHLDGLPTSTDEMVRLTTAVSDSTDDLDLATKAALGFNDMLIAGGANTAEMSTATDVFNRVLGKQSATVAQWQSLASVMPAQLNQVAEHMLGTGKNSQDLYNALNDGTVSWQDFLQAIADLDKSGYVDEAGRQVAGFEQQARAMSGGIGTAVDNVKNRIGAGWAAILDVFGQSNISGTIDNISYGIRDSMKRVADALAYVRDKIGETKIGENLGKVFAGIKDAGTEMGNKVVPVLKDVADRMVDWIDRALKWLVDHGDQIKEFFTKVGGALWDIGKTAGQVLEPLVKAGGDLIAKVFEWLIGHGDQVAGVLKALAAYLAFKGVVGAVGSATGAIGGIINSFKTLKDVLPMVGGLKDLPAAFQLVAEKGGPLGGLFQTISGKFGTFAGAVGGLKEKIANASWLGTLHDKFDGLGTKVMGLVPKMGEAFASIGGKIGSAVTGMVGNLGGLGGKIAEVGGMLGGKLAGGWSAFTGLIAAHPIALGIAAVAAAVAGLTWFFTQTELGRELWGKFTGFLQEAWGKVQEFFAGIPEFWGGIWEGAKTKCEEFVGNVKAGWEGLKTGAGEVFGAVKDSITSQLETAKTVGTETMGAFQSALQGDWKGTVKHAKAAFTEVDKTITGKLAAAKNSGIPIVSQLAGKALDVWQDLKKKLPGVLTQIGKDVVGKWSGIQSSVKGTVENIRSNVTNKWNEIKSSVGSAIDNIKTGAATKWNEIKSSVGSAVENIRSNVTNKWNQTKANVASAIGAIKTGATSKWNEIKSSVGSAVEGIKSNVTSKWSDIKSKVSQTVSDLRTAISEKWSDIKSKVGDTIGNIRSGALEKWGEIKDGIADRVSSIKDFIADKFGVTETTALDVFGNIREGIVGKIQDAKDTIEGIIETIKGLFDFDWSFPAPQLPHIMWHWEDLGGVVSVPIFDGIEWWAKGGVFDRPTVIGIGEAGTEAALPLNANTYRQIARGIQGEMQGGAGVVITGNNFHIREEADIDRVADKLNRKIRREGWAKR